MKAAYLKVYRELLKKAHVPRILEKARQIRAELGLKPHPELERPR